MAESVPNPPGDAESPDGSWYDELERSPDSVVIQPHGTEVRFIVPARTGFPEIDNAAREAMQVNDEQA